MDSGVVMRRVLHALFALAVLFGTWAQPQAAPAAQAEACACCQNEASCGCGMPQTPRTPRCPGGQTQATALVALEARHAPQAESAARQDTLPWEGLVGFSVQAVSTRIQILPELPRPPDRLLQRLALLSTFRN